MNERIEKEERAARLKEARVRAGFRGPAAVAEALKINANSYKAHEQGRNGFGIADARAYADLFGVNIQWLNFGIGSPTDADTTPKTVRLRQIFARLADAPEDLQAKVVAYAEFELSRLDSTTKPAS